MYFAKKGAEEPVTIIEDTTVYACESESCNGWMRKDFSTADMSCPMCGSQMSEEVRELPQIKMDYNPFSK
ncbi:cold-inducible protein YdjO-related protein [Metabacillus idriensis]|uniref:cold-inducible protein YdjO-related protein n=1 Tax=Metabacillus idriensis TaxID=324768 RepID=UPI00174A2FEF|nr:cold-inducible protein YdjO-related protein [Metabacillus idriensis]